MQNQYGTTSSRLQRAGLVVAFWTALLPRAALAGVLRDGDDLVFEVAPPAKLCVVWPNDQFDDASCHGSKARPVDKPAALPNGGLVVSMALARVPLPDDEARAVVTMFRVPGKGFQRGGEREFARGVFEGARDDRSSPGRMRDDYAVDVLDVDGTNVVRIAMERDVPPDDEGHIQEHRIAYALKAGPNLYVIDWASRREHAAQIDPLAEATIRSLRLAPKPSAKAAASKAPRESFVRDNAVTVGVIALLGGLFAFAFLRLRRSRPRRTKKRK